MRPDESRVFTCKQILREGCKKPSVFLNERPLVKGEKMEMC